MVEYKRKEIDRQFKRFLTDTEVVRNEPFSFTLTLTNIGTQIFPGGTIGHVRLEQVGLAGVVIDWSRTRLEGVAPITPQGFYEIKKLLAMLHWEGPCKLTFQLKAADGQPVEFYYADSARLGEEWLSFLYSVNRDSVLMLDLLGRILQRLEQPREKAT